MRNTLRITSVVALFVTATFLFTHFVYKSKDSVSQDAPAHPLSITKQTSTTTDERFMSFFPHGDFATQHEAVRNAFRIALETNRTLILPQVRLGTQDIPWAPYPILQKYYESQDKESLKTSCLSNTPNWRTEYQPCRDLNQWIELPWSTFFDFKALKTQFGIRVYERKWGHGWGVQESMLAHLQLSSQDVVIVDPNSFPSNGSDWDVQDKQKVVGGGNKWFSLFAKGQQQLDEVEASKKLVSPLKMLVTADQLLQLDERYIQFGSLVFGLRFQTSTSKKQSALQKGLRSNLFTSPNKFHETNLAAQKITAKMGGDNIYNVIHMNLEAVTRTELANQRSMMMENAEIDGTTYVNHFKEEHPDGTPYSPLELLQQLDDQTQTELMVSLVRELTGDMPIHQALSAAMPFQESELKTLLSQSAAPQRSTLLSACINYRKDIDTRYPIYYLTNDVYVDIHTHPELFGPLLEAFPCTFTPNDMYSWGVTRRDWASRIPGLNDPDVDYEGMLSPIVEILVARKGYSFFEVPNTKLTRLLSWH
ncbi:hypothetical protein HMPREF1544_10339 [Mucor circinelloides 1006PhL]|uniref:Uncharacterized protein n=1 Tax=Mucor circinelloides f. circinelloides (strain 1006PhL) TaxID=1220926 RepID=S2JK75_MUCC1|nr:hypothetical protein HMPREF1544_10339 [Mucor circinelloides 1006PhL]